MPTRLNHYIKKATKTSLLVACVFGSTISMAKTYPMLYHVVEKNETLTGLSKRFGIDVDYIIELNNIKKGPLTAGQKILVPDIGKVALNAAQPLSKKASPKYQKMDVVKVTKATPTMSRKVASKKAKSSTKTKKVKAVEAKVDSTPVVKAQPKIDRKALAKLNKSGNYDYAVQSGDTLGHIAMAFGVRTDILQQFNSIDDEFLLQVGDLIIIPNKANQSKFLAQPSTQAKKTTPTKNKATKQELKEKTSDKKPSKKIVAKKTSDATKPVIVAKHTVVSGDSLLAIALNNGVSVQALAEVNNLQNQDVLNVGQILKIPSQDYVPKAVMVLESTDTY